MSGLVSLRKGIGLLWPSWLVWWRDCGFPTETAFGIGCRLDKPESIRRLIQWRKREKGKPFLVLASDLKTPCGGWEKPSTVLDCTKHPWEVLREGAIKKEEIFV